MDEKLSYGVASILPENGLQKKLLKKKVLKVKLGMDPTAPDLHLGHAIVLRKLKEFQDLGHEVIFLIGDFTAKIGDPSGKSKTRPSLSSEEIAINSKTYFEQVGKILDINKATITYNSQWLSKLSFEDFIKIAGKVTLARIIEREDFQTRLQNNTAIGFHELFYPLMQAYDSVELKADVELGGTDQTFNLFMGRFLQEQLGQEPQVIITLPILEGLDGVHKMSKSLGNYIGLKESVDEAYGKLMSISDDLMWNYFRLLVQKTDTEIIEMQKNTASGKVHPMDLKKTMSYEVIRIFWSEKEAIQAKAQFEALFQKHDYSKATEVSLPKDFSNPAWIVDFLRALNAIQSSSEGKRLILEGAVSIDEEKIIDFKAEVSWKSGMVVKVGKHRIFKLK